MTRSALPQWFADPERGRAADDRRDGQNAEITSVERVGGLRIQEEDFVLADDAATLQDGSGRPRLSFSRASATATASIVMMKPFRQTDWPAMANTCFTSGTPRGR